MCVDRYVGYLPWWGVIGEMTGGGEGSRGGKFSCRCRCGEGGSGGVPVVGVCMQGRDVSDGIGALAAQMSLCADIELVGVC